MKLLTLNTHSLQEKDQEQKLKWFVEGILRERPDIIALQEVNQSCDAELAETELWEGQFLIPAWVPIRQDNYVAHVAYCLRKAGMDCQWAWFPIKRGYGKYEEGVALLSLGRKILQAEACFISKTQEHQNWRTRAMLGIQVENEPGWFYSMHLGWWDDTEEPFAEQWDRVQEHLRGKKEKIWLMGDFNAPDDIAGESYDQILQSGWMDTYRVAQEKDNGITVSENIDGWREKGSEGKRLDYIFCNTETEIQFSHVMFDGKREPVLSDHFGVMIQTKEK